MKSDRISQITAVLVGLLTSEAILPWFLIWLSDQLEFELPLNAILYVLAAPILAVLAALVGVVVRERH